MSGLEFLCDELLAYIIGWQISLNRGKLYFYFYSTMIENLL